jgi:flagellar biosynthesis component FlhA
MGLKGFEERLVKARKEKGYTQEDLSNRLGVTPQAVSKWERGAGYPDIELLYYISEVLECSVDDLLDREKPGMRLTESNDDKQKKQLLQNVLAEPLLLETGSGLIDILITEHKNQFPGIQVLRDKLALQYGILLPLIRIRDNDEIGETEFRIISYGRVLSSREVSVDKEIAFQEICEHLEKITLSNYSLIINRQIVKTLVDNLESKYPAVVSGVIPAKISYSLLQKILAGLVERKHTIRNLIKIVEILEDEVEITRDTERLLEILMKRQV